MEQSIARLVDISETTLAVQLALAVRVEKRRRLDAALHGALLHERQSEAAQYGADMPQISALAVQACSARCDFRRLSSDRARVKKDESAEARA